MRVPEISLVNELQAQNKHDLYRYHKYKREYQQTQYLTACTVSFMVVPSVRAWGFSYTVFSICKTEVSNHALFLRSELLPAHTFSNSRSFCSASGFRYFGTAIWTVTY